MSISNLLWFRNYATFLVSACLLDTPGSDRVNPLKNEVFPTFLRMVHRNCLIFGTKVNLVNHYTLEILKLFGKLTPLIPLNPLKKA